MSGTTALPFKCLVVIADVDGTLVDEDKRLTSRAIFVVAELCASGIVYSIISSCRLRGLRQLCGPLGINTPIGNFNGGVTAAADLSIITEQLSPAIARRTIDMLNALGVQVWVFSGQDWLVRDPEGSYVGREERTVGFPAEIVQDFVASLDSAAEIVGVRRASSSSHVVRAICVPRAPIMLQPLVRSHTTSTSPLRSPTKASHCRRSKLSAVPLAEIAVVGAPRSSGHSW
jgi:hypothetical protein